MKGLKKLYSPDDSRWTDPNSTFRSDEFDIIRQLSRRYPVKDLCELMGVSRAGYYNHLHLREKGELRSEKLRYAIALVSDTHESHPSHGYRWIAAFIRKKQTIIFQMVCGAIFTISSKETV